MGPLLIEIERPMNDKLGLVLCNYTPAVPPPTATVSGSSASGSSTPSSQEKIPEESSGAAGVFIASILPASIADRYGILIIGDIVRDQMRYMTTPPLAIPVAAPYPLAIRCSPSTTP